MIVDNKDLENELENLNQKIVTNKIFAPDEKWKFLDDTLGPVNVNVVKVEPYKFIWTLKTPETMGDIIEDDADKVTPVLLTAGIPESSINLVEQYVKSKVNWLFRIVYFLWKEIQQIFSLTTPERDKY